MENVFFENDFDIFVPLHKFKLYVLFWFMCEGVNKLMRWHVSSLSSNSLVWFELTKVKWQWGLAGFYVFVTRRVNDADVVGFLLFIFRRRFIAMIIGHCATMNKKQVVLCNQLTKHRENRPHVRYMYYMYRYTCNLNNKVCTNFLIGKKGMLLLWKSETAKGLSLLSVKANND